MYETHFGLRRRPFRATPDIDAYYPATTHEHCLAALQRGLAEDEGFLLLTGMPGTGKTILCHRLIERLDTDTTAVFLTHGRLPSRAALLQSILFDLSLPWEGKTEQELRLALTDTLLQKNASGQATLLIVDEAHHLSADLLEELRLLGNLEAGTAKAVQAVLVAQPEIQEQLRAVELVCLRQRLVTCCHLEPLGIEEASDFLLHQVRAAGGRPNQILSGEALTILAQGSGGLPRLLCQVGHRALSLAHAANEAQVDAEAALEALASLGLGEEASTCTEVSDHIRTPVIAEHETNRLVHSGRPAVFTVGTSEETTDDDQWPLTVAPRKPA